MCDRVDRRIDCPQCGYPACESQYLREEFPQVKHSGVAEYPEDEVDIKLIKEILK